MGLLQNTITLIVLGLFVIAILGFAINFAKDNNAPIDISDDSEISNLYTETSGNLSNFRGGSQSTYESIVEASIDEGETTPSGGQFAITPVQSISVTKNILRTGYKKIFGTDNGFSIFLTTLISIIVFTIALFVWKAWVGRIPD